MRHEQSSLIATRHFMGEPFGPTEEVSGLFEDKRPRMLRCVRCWEHDLVDSIVALEHAQELQGSTSRTLSKNQGWTATIHCWIHKDWGSMHVPRYSHCNGPEFHEFRWLHHQEASRTRRSQSRCAVSEFVRHGRCEQRWRLYSTSGSLTVAKPWWKWRGIGRSQRKSVECPKTAMRYNKIMH